MANKRLYVVTEKLDGGRDRFRLVNAVSKAAALNFVVEPKHVVSVAGVQDVAFLMGQGILVEEAGDPEVVAPTSPVIPQGEVSSEGLPLADPAPGSDKIGLGEQA